MPEPDDIPELPPLADEGPPSEAPAPSADAYDDLAAPDGSDELSGARLPQNIEAEQALLGGLLLAPEQYDVIDGRVDVEDFFVPAHGVVFAAMAELRRRAQPLDPLLLRDELARQDALDRIGGAAGLAALAGAAASGAHTEHYARVVREKAMLRRLIAAATDILRKAVDSHEPAPAVMDYAEHLVFQVASRGVSGEALPLEHVLQTMWSHLRPMDGRPIRADGVRTGYVQLDDMLTGLHPDELVILAARPSVGKTTFGLNLLRHVVLQEKAGAAFFSIEMSAENIARHLLVAAAQVPAQKLRHLNFSESEMRDLQRHSERLNKARLWIDETPAISLAELRGKARRLKARHDIKLVIVDYLQLMTASALAAKRGREQEVSEISRGLKALAKELHVPVVALAQLSRKAEGRQDGRPLLSDLRESGAIEQDADVVMMLHRDPAADMKAPTVPMELIVAKQRNGPTGVVELTFRRDVLRFENLDTRDAPAGSSGAPAPAPP